MQKNELVNISIPLTLDTYVDDIVTPLSNYSHIYSYIVYKQPHGYLVDILYSKTARYNTIPVDTLAVQIYKDILRPRRDLRLTSNIVTYAQPPLEILITTYKPLVYRLAFRQHRYWQDVEIDDLIQMCNLRICILYQQGYYIHAGIINRSFINHVLQFLKPERYKPQMIPIDEVVPGTDIPLVDTIIDESVTDEFTDVEDDVNGSTLHDEIICEGIRTVKDFLTPRMFDQMLRQYSTNTTDNTTRVMMSRLKRQLAALGITMQTIKESVIQRR